MLSSFHNQDQAEPGCGRVVLRHHAVGDIQQRGAAAAGHAAAGGRHQVHRRGAAAVARRQRSSCSGGHKSKKTELLKPYVLNKKRNMIQVLAIVKIPTRYN